MTHVALVDDNLTSLAQMKRLLAAGGFNRVQVYDNPGTALASFAEAMPDVIVADYLMPQLDGIGLTRQVRHHRQGPHVAVALVTGMQSRSFLREALEAGVVDVIRKPIEPAEFVQKVRNLAAIASRSPQPGNDFTAFTPLRPAEHKAWSEQVHEVATARCFEVLAAMRDESTGRHTTRMAHYAVAIARAMGVDEARCRLLLAAAPLHDIGKIGIPDAILNKPGTLTEGESRIMRRHTQIGHHILKDHPSPVLQTGAEIALSHHERFDGKGYPFGLEGRVIPLFGRIVAVADVFDALTTVRPYKPAWLIERALPVIDEGSGAAFDPEVVQAFHASLDDIRVIKRHFDDEVAYLEHDLTDAPTQPAPLGDLVKH